MNIGLFTETYYPELNGVATSVLTLKTELEKMGHNVYVFTTTTPGSPEHEHNVFRVPSLPCVLVSERRVGMFYQPKLAGIIKKLNLDLIHTHTEFSLGIFGRIMARELHLPVIHTYHTIYEDYTHYIAKFKSLDKGAKAFVRSYTKLCCNGVETVIVPTEKVKDLLTEYSVYREIEVIPTGINLEKFEESKYSVEEIQMLRQKYGIQKDDKVILYIGRLAKEKNLDEVLKDIPDFMERHQDAKMVIVGDGAYRETLEKCAEKLSCRDNILFLGEQPWDEIAKFYRLGDVFISASTSETQGLTYIEAMASGLPVVAKKDRCLDGILENGYNGFTFETEEEMQNALENILYQNADTDYAGNSRAGIQKYSTAEFAKNVEKLYNHVLEHHERKKQKIPDKKIERTIQ